MGSSEVLQFLEKNQDHNGATISESQISTGDKHSTDKLVGYPTGDMHMVMKEQQVDGNYKGVERRY